MSESYSASVPHVNDVAPTPAYFAVIPASVRYSDVPPAAKLLYGEITALTNVRGYCWALNPYFQALYKVDRATVKRWLSALSDAGFIRVEVDRAKRERRIYCCNFLDGNVPKKDGDEAAQKCAIDGAKMRHMRRENAPQIKTVSNEVNKTSSNVAPTGLKFVGPGPVTARELRNAEPPSAGQLTPSEMVKQVVQLTGDVGSERRFWQLAEFTLKNKQFLVWSVAYNATETALEGGTAPDRPGAYFVAVLAHQLARAGLRVPGGSVRERAEIQRLAAQSLAAADAAQAERQRTAAARPRP